MLTGLTREITHTAFAIKAEVRDLRARTFAFTAQKTMYGGKHIAKGDRVFIFASENDGGHGLIARGWSLPPTRWRTNGRPESELSFKLYRQATNKIAGISAEAAALLESFFQE